MCYVDKHLSWVIFAGVLELPVFAAGVDWVRWWVAASFMWGWYPCCTQADKPSPPAHPAHPSPIHGRASRTGTVTKRDLEHIGVIQRLQALNE
jgi:hypothetical protein